MNQMYHQLLKSSSKSGLSLSFSFGFSQLVEIFVSLNSLRVFLECEAVEIRHKVSIYVDTTYIFRKRNTFSVVSMVPVCRPIRTKKELLLRSNFHNLTVSLTQSGRLFLLPTCCVLFSLFYTLNSDILLLIEV